MVASFLRRLVRHFFGWSIEQRCGMPRPQSGEERPRLETGAENVTPRQSPLLESHTYAGRLALTGTQLGCQFPGIPTPRPLLDFCVLFRQT